MPSSGRIMVPYSSKESISFRGGGTHFSLHKIAERGFRVDVILNISGTAEQLRIVAAGAAL